MVTILLIVHLFVTLALIGVVLIQRSEGGGLGIGSSQGMGGFMSGRGTANLLTRTTAVLGTAFFAIALTLALLNRGTTGVGRSILDTPPPVSAPANGQALEGVGPALSGAGTTPMPGPSSGPNSGPTAAGAPESPAAQTAPAVPKAPAVPTN